MNSAHPALLEAVVTVETPTLAYGISLVEDATDVARPASDSLSAARGILIGLALSIPCWLAVAYAVRALLS